MTQKETMLLGEIKGQLETIYTEHGNQFKTLFIKIDEINKDGLPICKSNMDILNRHEKKIAELEKFDRSNINPFTIISSGGGIAGILGILFFMIGKSKGWW